MSRSAKIQTDLLNQPVTIVHGFPNTELDGKRGKIRSTYLDKEGEPKLTVELYESRRLVEVYTHAVQLRG